MADRLNGSELVHVSIRLSRTSQLLYMIIVHVQSISQCVEHPSCVETKIKLDASTDLSINLYFV